MAPPQQRSPRRGKGGRRTTLPEATAQLFARHGYRATTPEQLAEAAAAAGLPGPVSRAEQFAEILTRLRSAALLRWAAEPDAPADPEAHLRLAARVFLEVSLRCETEVAAVHRALVEVPHEEIQEALQALTDELVTWLAGLIRAGQQVGLIRRALDPQVGAWHLVYTALGLLAAAPLNRAVRARLDYLSPAIDCVLNGLLKRDV